MGEAELKPHLLKLGGNRLLHSSQHSLPKRSAQCPLLLRLSRPTGQCTVTLKTPLPVILTPMKAQALLFQVCCPLHEFCGRSPAHCPISESVGLKDGHGSSCFPIVLDLLLEGPWGSPHLVLSPNGLVFLQNSQFCSSQHPTTSNSAQTPEEVQANYSSTCCLQACSFHSK